MRGALVSYLSTALCGDTLAAEYLLLGLLSRVQRRRDSVLVGTLPVSIVNATPQVERLVEEAIGALCTRVLSVTVTVGLCGEI